jgi:uncharacterized delta-60 repeat protein
MGTMISSAMWGILRATGLVGSMLGLAASSVALVAAPDALDSSFGQGGHVVVQANSSCQSHGCTEMGGSYAEAIALGPNGQVVLGGSNNYIGSGANSAGKPAGAIAGLDADGAVDRSFGGNGGVVASPSRVSRLYNAKDGGLTALGSNGETIEAAHYSNNGALESLPGSPNVSISAPGGLVSLGEDRAGRILALSGESEGEIRVERYSASGQPDSSFGKNGTVDVPLKKTATPIAFASLGDGGVIVVGGVTAHNTAGSAIQKLIVARLTSTGSLRSSFGVQGIATLPISHPRGGVVAVAPNGHILVATTTESVTGHLSSSTLALTNLTSTGRLDRKFGRGGIARSTFRNAQREGLSANAMTVDLDGNPVVVGERPMSTVDVPQGVGFIARYTGRGRDCSFGNHGVVIDQGLGGANAVAVQPDGRIVVAGWATKAFAAVRYLAGGASRTCSEEG